MSSDVKTSPKGTRLWMRIVLVVSLGLNLLVVGAIAGIAIKGGPFKHGGPPSHLANQTIGPFTRALTLNDRRLIMRELRRQGEAEGWTREKHRQSMEEMVLLLEATPFDPDAFGNAFEATVNGLQNRLLDASDAFVLRLSDMTDEERAAYAARVREEMDKKPRKKP